MKKLLTNIIGSVAPTLGTALGGPLGGMAGDVISKVLGCDNDPVSLEKAISAATPEQLLEIKKAEKEMNSENLSIQLVDVTDFEAIENSVKELLKNGSHLRIMTDFLLDKN